MKIDYNKKYCMGEIIYPHYNGTAVWYKRNIWAVVVEIDEGFALAIRFFRCQDSAFVYSELIKHLMKSIKD